MANLLGIKPTKNPGDMRKMNRKPNLLLPENCCAVAFSATKPSPFLLANILYEALFEIVLLPYEAGGRYNDI
jgi:hypothetical protein